MNPAPAADDVIERLARELAVQAEDEERFMAQMGIPPELGRELAIVALRRAAMKMEAKR